jgi:hypothetical protein
MCEAGSDEIQPSITSNDEPTQNSVTATASILINAVLGTGVVETQIPFGNDKPNKHGSS